MTLTLFPASREDIPRLVQILFSAFANDPLLMKCYPATSANHAWWTQTFLNQMQHPSTVIMKITSDETGETVSFAKWLIHREFHNGTSSGGASGAVQPTNPSPDMNVPACKSLSEAQYKMRTSLMSTRSHICKTYPFSITRISPHQGQIKGLTHWQHLQPTSAVELRRC